MYLTYYYTKNITHPSKNVVRVWERWNLTEKGVLAWVQELGKEYENLSHFIILWEINCAEKKSRSLSETSYDNKGKVIISSSLSFQNRCTRIYIKKFVNRKEVT
jgi:hypothetical protein